MTKLKEIELMNETMIAYLQKLEISSERNEIIKQILKDEACFFKMEKEDAHMVLKEVGVSNHIEEIYAGLISREEFYRLQQSGKINEDDDLKIKYEAYNEIFKKKETEKRANTNIVPYKKNVFQELIEKLRSMISKK